MNDNYYSLVPMGAECCTHACSVHPVMEPPSESVVLDKNRRSWQRDSTGSWCNKTAYLDWTTLTASYGPLNIIFIGETQ